MNKMILMMVAVVGLLTLPTVTATPDDPRDTSIRIMAEAPVTIEGPEMPVDVQHEATCGSFAFGFTQDCSTALGSLHCCGLYVWLEPDFGFSGRITNYGYTSTGYYVYTCWFDMAGVIVPDCDPIEGAGVFYSDQTITVRGTASGLPVGGWGVGLGNY